MLKKIVLVSALAGSWFATAEEVAAQTPTITSISPASGRVPGSLSATITGTNLDGATTVTFTFLGGFTDGEVTAAIRSGGTSTSLPITVFIGGFATPGPRSLRVTAAGGMSDLFSVFNVIAHSEGVPTLTSISPATGIVGTSFSATITGTNFDGATAVTFTSAAGFPDDGVTATIGTGGTSTSLPITITIDGDAQLGARTPRVTAAGGMSDPLWLHNGFTVTGPTILPKLAMRGTSLSAIILGNNLTGVTALTFSGSGVAAVIEPGATETGGVPITITVDAGATLGARSFVVTTADGTSMSLPGITVVPSDPGGLITTIAGGAVSGSPFANLDDGIPARLTAMSPRGVAVDDSGNVFVADVLRSRIRKISTDGLIQTVAGTFSPSPAFPNGNGEFLWGWSCEDGVRVNAGPGDGGPATSATLQYASRVAVDRLGNFYISGDAPPIGRVRMVSPDGIIVSFAGCTNMLTGPSAGLASNLHGVAVDGNGNLFIADTSDHRIRKVDNAGNVSTIAGNGTQGFGGDGGPAVSAMLNDPRDVAVDAAGNLYIADSGNSRIRQVTPDGTITTVAGTGTAGYSGDGGPATAAMLSSSVQGIAVTPSGTLFIADGSNYRVRKVSPDGIISTVVGTGTRGFNGDGGPPGSTFLSAPGDVDVDKWGNLYIAEGGRVRKVTFPWSVMMSHSGNFAAGFNGTYDIAFTNQGSVPTGPLTLTDTLPPELSFVAAEGSGWSCAAAAPTVTCNSSAGIAVGETSSIQLTVAVGRNAGPSVINKVAVTSAGGEISFDNSAQDATRIVRVSAPTLTFVPSAPQPGQQATLGLSLPEPFPHELRGTLNLTFDSSVAIPVDDPAIQFASGGRQAEFTFAANSTTATFAGSSQPGPIGFQPGTVAGTLTFQGTLGPDENSVPFGSSSGGALSIAPLPPQIQGSQTTAQPGGFAVSMTLLSSMREVTDLVIEFITSPAASLSCGSLSGCVASGSTMTLDVKSLFDDWYAGDSVFGSMSVLRLPFTIQGGKLGGTVAIRLRNSRGLSNPAIVTIPPVGQPQ